MLNLQFRKALMSFFHSRNAGLCYLLLLSSLLLHALSAQAAPATSAAPPFRKVFVIVLENTPAHLAEQQAYLQALRQRGAYLSQFYAAGHPSQPNYLALTAGTTFGISSNATVDLEARHIGDLLEAAGKQWRQYAEDYPGHCFSGASNARYVRKHAPFISYNNVRNNPARCARLVNAEQLDADIAQGKLADFSLYIPNMDNDGHDQSVAYADLWLRQHFDKRFNDPHFMKDMLVVVTFDEDDYQHDNRVYAVLLGPGVKPGVQVDVRYDFYSLLRTVEQHLGLGSLGQGDAQATAINGVWR